MIGSRIISRKLQSVQVGSTLRRGLAKERVVTPEEAKEARDEIGGMMGRAHAAQAKIADYDQDQVNHLIKAMVWSVCQPGRAEDIAQFTVDESRLGNYDGKFLKINRKTRAALYDIIDDKSVGILEEDVERNLVKIAKPVGVIGALSPSTNPEATPVIKAISAIKGRNAIVIAPHPRAKETNKMIIDYMREALEKCGAPADLVIAIPEPSLQKTNELMKQCDRVLATGGNPMVHAAYSSGTPALGVGVGNAVVTVDDTADLDEAADKIVISKTLDLAASCSADNSLLVFDSVYDQLLPKLVERGGYVLGDADKAKLQAAIWVNGALNANIVAQPFSTIAGIAGIDAPTDKKFFIVPETGVGPDAPFSGEKLCVTLTLYKVGSVQEAITRTNDIQAYQGQGHSCGIYSKNDANIMALASNTKTSRVMVNQPQAASNSGNLWNGMRQTFSLGCGSWGGNSVNHNITWRDLINETWVSKPLVKAKELPSDEELFGDVMKM